ncbi:hypothetical protein RI367_004131 [Sorochytrium milnesiophthora]
MSSSLASTTSCGVFPVADIGSSALHLQWISAIPSSVVQDFAADRLAQLTSQNPGQSFVGCLRFADFFPALFFCSSGTVTTTPCRVPNASPCSRSGALLSGQASLDITAFGCWSTDAAKQQWVCREDPATNGTTSCRVPPSLRKPSPPPSSAPVSRPTAPQGTSLLPTPIAATSSTATPDAGTLTGIVSATMTPIASATPMQRSPSSGGVMTGGGDTMVPERPKGLGAGAVAGIVLSAIVMVMVAGLLIVRQQRRTYPRKARRVSAAGVRSSQGSSARDSDPSSDMSFPALMAPPPTAPAPRRHTRASVSTFNSAQDASRGTVNLTANFGHSSTRIIDPRFRGYDMQVLSNTWDIFRDKTLQFLQQTMLFFPVDMSPVSVAPVSGAVSDRSDDYPESRLQHLTQSFNDIFFAHYLQGRLTAATQLPAFLNSVRSHGAPDPGSLPSSYPSSNGSAAMLMGRDNSNNNNNTFSIDPPPISTHCLFKAVAVLLQDPVEREAFFNEVAAQDIAQTGQDFVRMFERNSLPVDADAIYGFLENATELFFRLKSVCPAIAFSFPSRGAPFNGAEMIAEQSPSSPSYTASADWLVSCTLWPGLVDADRDVVISRARVLVA